MLYTGYLWNKYQCQGHRRPKNDTTRKEDHSNIVVVSQENGHEDQFNVDYGYHVNYCHDLLRIVQPLDFDFAGPDGQHQGYHLQDPHVEINAESPVQGVSSVAGDNEIIFNDSLLLQEKMHITMIAIIGSL